MAVFVSRNESSDRLLVLQCDAEQSEDDPGHFAMRCTLDR